MAHKIDLAISLVAGYLNGRFFNPLDEENEIYSKDWRDVVGTCYDGSEVVSCFSKDNRFICFNFRLMRNHDVFVEVSTAPHQMWKYYNLSKKEDIKELGKILGKDLVNC